MVSSASPAACGQQARLEPGKHYEHRTRDLASAERLCVETIQFLETRTTLGRDTDLDTWHIEAFRHRLDRVRRKLSRGRRED